MDDHPQPTDDAIDQIEQELLISTVSDEALEKAACGTSCAQTYPQTCVATICVGGSIFPKKLSGQSHTRDEAGNIAELPELTRASSDVRFWGKADITRSRRDVRF
jgi:hypothetical protein